MSQYETLHVKRDPESGAVAIRTIQPDDPKAVVPQAWLMATPHFGAHNKSTADVEGWDDLYVPPAPAPERAPESAPAAK